MVKKCARYNIGLRRITTDDGSFLLLMLFTVAVISAGIIFRLNVLQWAVIAVLSSLLLFTGFYRSAAHVLTIYDDSISLDRAVQIKALSNVLVTFTAGITFFTYLMIFMPKINQLL